MSGTEHRHFCVVQEKEDEEDDNLPLNSFLEGRSKGEEDIGWRVSRGEVPSEVRQGAIWGTITKRTGFLFLSFCLALSCFVGRYDLVFFRQWRRRERVRARARTKALTLVLSVNGPGCQMEIRRRTVD